MSPKVVAIVGCGMGFGGALALRFAQEGYSIAAMARSAQSLDYVKAKLAKVQASDSEVKHGFYQMDATKKEDVDAAFAKVVAELGAVSVLVYNISDTPKALNQTVLEIKPEDYMDTFNVNALGALLCTQAVLPAMLASDGWPCGAKGLIKKGTILYTSATAAFRSTAKAARLAAGKMALRGLSQSVAKEYGKQGVHAVHVRMDCTYESARNEKMFESFGHADFYHKGVEANKMANIDDLAETYYQMHLQSPMAWSNEIDLRPFTEDWTY
jgi:NAD(P)-dependent dehydrogenase (short-subunit alcohol dehydrogenase family)